QKNFGANTVLQVAPNNVSALIKFDLSALPAGTCPEDIDKATVLLWLYAVTTPGGVSAAVVSSPWTESGVTWNSKPTWGALTASATIPSAGGQYVLFNVTNQIKALLASGACTPPGSPVTNFGLLLSSTAPTGANFLFNSRENVGNGPLLDI